jgi:hypothetical protein
VPYPSIAPGERMLIRCVGGPSQTRLERMPPQLEITEDDGVYVLVDDGPPQEWWYQFVPT